MSVPFGVRSGSQIPPLGSLPCSGCPTHPNPFIEFRSNSFGLTARWRFPGFAIQVWGCAVHCCRGCLWPRCFSRTVPLPFLLTRLRNGSLQKAVDPTICSTSSSTPKSADHMTTFASVGRSALPHILFPNGVSNSPFVRAPICSRSWMEFRTPMGAGGAGVAVPRVPRAARRRLARARHPAHGRAQRAAPLAGRRRELPQRRLPPPLRALGLL